METIFECKAGELLNAIQSVSKAIDQRAKAPIMRNILVEASADGTARLTASGASVQLGRSVRLGTKANTEITFNPQLVSSYLKTYPADTNIKLLLNDEKKIVVQAGRNRSSHVSLPAQDFLQMTAFGAASEPVTVAAEVLRKLLAQTVFCAADKDARAFLNGVCLEIEGDNIRAVSTDGHRMALSSATLPGVNAPKTSVIIPKDVAVSILKILTDGVKGKKAPQETEASVSIQFSLTQAMFSFEDFNIRTLLLSGKFPDYDRLFPKNNLVLVEVCAADLENVLNAADAIRTDNRVLGITLSTNSTDELSLFAKNSEKEEYESTVPAQIQGGTVSCGYNIKYLKEVMHLFGKDDVCAMSFPSATSSNETLSLMRKTADGLDSFQYVVMPMRV
ncbi:MAG: DNA polymerase III subunit beta [Actinomycetaceae bacterium]|nr:DNA polymerase III subunit beta [Actinomycetaceae bacterium]